MVESISSQMADHRRQSNEYFRGAKMTKKQRDEKRAAEQMALLNKITNDAHDQARKQNEEIKQQDIIDSLDESKAIRN